MASLVALRSSTLSIDDAIAAVSHSGAGAVSIFLGIVRDRNDGKPVVGLEYEAYEPMALAEMRRIAAEVVAASPAVRVAAIHRTGRLSVGDTAVVCAASAPHRGEAARACMALIDAVKARVPIWKREHGPDGAAHWLGWDEVSPDAR
jgi:molybdopterin synthase catalytic subunit